MRKRQLTNPQLSETIAFLKRQGRQKKAKIWLDIADDLSKPRRSRIEVNLSDLARHTAKNEIVVVPGKVLGTGFLKHPVVVGAFMFSNQAKARIQEIGGKCLELIELAKQHPKGSGVRILG